MKSPDLISFHEMMDILERKKFPSPLGSLIHGSNCSWPEHKCVWQYLLF